MSAKFNALWDEDTDGFDSLWDEEPEAAPDARSLFGPVVEEEPPPPPPPPPQVYEPAAPMPENMPPFQAGSVPKVQMSPEVRREKPQVPAVNQAQAIQELLAKKQEALELQPPPEPDASAVMNLPQAQKLPDVQPGQPFIPEAQGIDYQLSLGDKAKAVAQGVGSGLTMNTYQPEVKPGTEIYYGAGNIPGMALGGAAIAGASALTGGAAPAMAMAGLGGAGYIAMGNDLKSRGIDPSRLTEPEMQALMAASGISNIAIPGSVGKTRLGNTLSGGAIGAGTNVGQELAAAAATGTEADVFTAGLLGAGLGTGAGLAGPARPVEGGQARQPIDFPVDAPPAGSKPGDFEALWTAVPDQAEFTDDAVEASFTRQYEQPKPTIEEVPNGPVQEEGQQGRQEIPPRPPRSVDPYTQGGDGGSLNELVYSKNFPVAVTDDVRDQLGLWDRDGSGNKRPWALARIKKEFPRLQWKLAPPNAKIDPFNNMREAVVDGGFGLSFDGKHYSEIDEHDFISAIAQGLPHHMRGDGRERLAPRMESDDPLQAVRDHYGTDEEIAERARREPLPDEEPMPINEGRMAGEGDDGEILFDVAGQQNMFGGEEANNGRPKPKAEQVDMFAGQPLQPDQGPIRGGTKGLENTPLQSAADQAETEEGQTVLLSPESERNELMAERRYLRADHMAASEDDIPRMHVAQRLRKVTDRVAAGKMAPEEAVREAERLADRVAVNNLARRLRKGLNPRQRGHDIIREKLLAARRRGEIDYHEAEMSMWLMEKNPALVEDLGISVRRSSGEGGQAGNYNPASRLITLIKGSTNSGTGVHEILHHTERMMPPEIRGGILREWAKAYTREFAGASWKKLQGLHEIGEVNSGRGSREKLMEKFRSGRIDRELYQYFDPSEFWAVNGTRIMSARYDVSDNWVGKARQWFKEFVEKLKSVFGAKSDMAILRGLDSVLRSDGSRQSREMLNAAVGRPNLVAADVEAGPTSFEGARKKRAELQQKQGEFQQSAPLEGENKAAPVPAKRPPGERDPGLQGGTQEFTDPRMANPPSGRPGGPSGTPPPRGDGPLFPKSFDAPDETRWDYFLRRVQDKMRPVKTVQRAIEKAGRNVREETDTYLSETLYHGRTGAALRNADKDHTSPILQKMKEAGLKMETVDKYLYARHAPERNAQIARINSDPDRGSGMSDKRAERLMAVFKGRGQLEKLKAVGELVDKANQKRLDVLEASGLISTETRKTWEATYKHYVPLKGFAEAADDVDQVRDYHLGEGFSTRGKESKRALGRTGLAASPLATSIAQLNEAIVRAEKNAVAKTFLKMVLDNPNKDLWRVNKTQVKQVMQGGQVAQRVEVEKNDPNVIVAKVLGKEYYITVEKKYTPLALAMKNMGEEKAGFIVKTLGQVNKALALINTTYAPEFVLSNFLRDLQTAGINLSGEQSGKFAAKVAKDILPAMRGALQGIRESKTLIPSKNVDKWEAWYKRFEKAGGKTEYLGLKSVEDIRKEFESMLGKPTAWGKTKEGLKKTFGVVEDVNTAVENAVRLSAFKHAVESGLSEAKAAALAKNLTVNFNRKGELGTLANSLYLFFNANVQGTARLLAALAKPNTPAGKKLWGISAGLTATSMGLALWNRAHAGEDEDGVNRYDKITPFVKERNLVIMMPGKDGKGTAYTIPVPYGYNIFHVVGESLADMLMGGDKDAAALNVAMAMTSAFNPLGSESSRSPGKWLAKMATPTIADPLAQWAMNEDFMGAPVKPEQLPFGTPKPSSQLAFKSVSPTAKAIAEGVNKMTGGSDFRSGAVDFSPETLEHFVTSYSGSLGKFMVNSMQYVSNTAQGEETDIAKTPFARKFIQGENKFFDQKAFTESAVPYKQVVEEANNLDGEELKKFEEEFGPQIELGELAKEIQKEVEELNKDAKSIRNDPALTKADKAAQLKEIEAEKTKLFREFNKEARARKASKKL